MNTAMMNTTATQLTEKEKRFVEFIREGYGHPKYLQNAFNFSRISYVGNFIPVINEKLALEKGKKYNSIMYDRSIKGYKIVTMYRELENH